MMATSLLERLMGGTEETRSILVQDSSQCNGRLLLKAIALQSLERFSFVHIFLFDVHSQFWLSGVPLESVKRLTIHDCYSDHLGWNSSSQSGPAPLHEATPISFLHRIERTCGQATPTTKGMQSEYAIIIDSLSTILEFHSTSHICRLVHQLGGESRLIVCLLHSDVHESHVTSQLSHVMSTTITLTPPLHPGPHWQARLQHCKISGKLLVQTELVSVSGDYTVKSLPSGTNHSHLYQTQQVPPDPAANLTFDLTLSDREKEERSRLALPYHHSAEQKTALLSAGSSSGKIFYQPDEADDFDDSDPDDDLDL